jgi:2-iminobutanoate/2-iminopropanoate deaminase
MSSTRIAAIAVVLLVAGLAGQARKQFVAPPWSQRVPYSQAVRAGNLVYVGEQFPVDARGNLVDGDIGIQIRQVFDNLKDALQKAGSSIDHVVGVNVIYRSFNEYQGVDVAFRQHFKSRNELPSRDTNFTKLLFPGAIVAMSATAVPNGVSRSVVPLSPNWAKETVAFNYAVIGDDTFMFTTCGRVLETFGMFAGPFRDQARLIMDDAAAFLKNAGLTFDDVVSTQVVLENMHQLREFDEVYRSYWKKDLPARVVYEGSCGSRRPDSSQAKVAVTAIRGAAARKRVIAQPAGASWTADAGASAAIQMGDRLYVSGLTGATAASKGDLRAQTTEALTRLGQVLKSAGFAYSDVVFSEVFITTPHPPPAPEGVVRVFETTSEDAQKVMTMDAGYRPFFPANPPARNAISTGRLPEPDALVQVFVKAVK